LLDGTAQAAGGHSGSGASPARGLAAGAAGAGRSTPRTFFFLGPSISASFERFCESASSRRGSSETALGGAADVAHHVHHHGHALLHVVVAGRAHHAEDARWAPPGRR
jgi:hypothetical protein